MLYYQHFCKRKSTTRYILQKEESKSVRLYEFKLCRLVLSLRSLGLSYAGAE